MSTHEKETFLQTYQWAKEWSQLPWAHEEPTLFLAEICQRRAPGRALDIGCGSGTDSVYLATRGWDVTALDFVPKALEFTARRAEQAGASVTTVEADITAWDPPQGYDLVLDHGLLHNMDPVRYPAYRERLVQAVAEDGDFVLLHWHPLYPGQAQGKVGPKRSSREEIRAFFAPDFQERYFAREEFDDLPDMVGGGMSQAYYWFGRNPAHFHPGQLMEQINATLSRHGVDADGLSGPPALDAGLLARVIGPGRLGLTLDRPAPEQAAAALAEWAAAHGQEPELASRLIGALASEALGGICTANPRCNECEVKFCKRLRYR